MSGASRIIVTSVIAAVTISANWVRAPASRFTAVWVVPPPPGIAPRSAPPAFAMPVASNSLLACGQGSSLRAKARPAAIVSVKLMSAIPKAPGQSCVARENAGR